MLWLSWIYEDGDMESKQRSTYYALARNPNVDKSDLQVIKAFYDEYGISYRTSLHTGERREAHRKILTKILTLFIYIPSSLRQSTSISLYLKSFYKMQAASYSTLQAQNRERHIETSRDTFLDTLLLPPHQSCITISLLCRTL